MVPCPRCGKNVAKPVRTFETFLFKIDDYQCDGCGNRFEAIS
ncbi:MAG: hypothetical protein ACQCN3_11985 [Candidatus Bathyarchaeia archaeon]